MKLRIPFLDDPVTLATPEGQVRRMASLRRSLMNELKRKPTTAEITALNRAIRLTLRAELAAADPHTCLDDVVRLDGAAARARKAWSRLVETRRAAAPTLADYVRSKSAGAAP